MEELKSTEALDKEILEDARKKASRILKSADDTVRNSADSWEKKTENSVAELTGKYRDRTEQGRAEIMARLPLDKQRIRSERAEKLLYEAMDTFLSKLSREKLLSILERELSSRCGELPDTGLTIRYRHIETGEAESLLKKVIPGRTWTAAPEDPAYTNSGTFPEIQVDGPDIRIIASVDGVEQTLLEDKRAELAAALLGEGALND
ncbi:ATPase [Breznakiella homolactica]|uniref:ATPase n=1 Tax=Breznakiella homolactica TaxID=2798577 RepID=A0A7T7XRR8_9SPIR|nr:ATPase [Breznakiella homolactica]QQO11229.1 ATPase [Breznakiella homolactica]